MMALYEPVIVATFQMLCGLGAVVCGVLALKEHGGDKSTGSGDGRAPYSPWLMYCLGLVGGCLFAHVVKYLQRPETVLEAVALHVSVVALLLILWSVCSAYARLWSRSQRITE